MTASFKDYLDICDPTSESNKHNAKLSEGDASAKHAVMVENGPNKTKRR